MYYWRKIILDQERILVERAKNDKEAFAELYDKYCSQILGYVIKRTANIEVAQDVTSQVFFKAYKNIGQFQWRGVPFSSWLYKIASNEITNHFRERKRRRQYLENNYDSEVTPNPSPESELAQAQEDLQKYEEFLSVHENISKLSFKYQEVITLRYFEHKQLKDIGVILGKNEGTVKSLLYRGLKKLRILME
ncbi:RNA polymerase sigma factor [Chloroflexota bacterium]